MQINSELKVLGILPSKVNSRRRYHGRMVAEMRELWGDAVLPVELHDRAAFALAKERPVWRTERKESRSVAAQEMRAVCSHIYSLMGR